MEDAVRALREEARSANERRVLVLAGDPHPTREAVEPVLDAAEISLAETTLLGPRRFLDCEHHPHVHADELLGRTRTAVVVDLQEATPPNVIGRAVGAVDGGGLLVLLVPPLAGWADRSDGFDEALAVPPFEESDVTGRFRERFVETLRAHPGIAIVDVETGAVERDGLMDPAPRLASEPPSVPADAAFPESAYRACLTGDQVEAVAALEAVRKPGAAVVLEADRGRGKSSAAGIGAACLAAAGRDVLVTAPEYGNAAEVFARAVAVLDALGVLVERNSGDEPRRLDTDEGCVRFVVPTEAIDLPGEPDVVVVDEAAALPVRVLSAFLDAPSVVFATTVHGYEGTGRGFAVRFRDRLAESAFAVRDVTLIEPIRYATGDPVESWAFRALLLDARPAVDQVIEDAGVETVTYERFDRISLAADEHRLREVFGLLVLAHYRTEPDDLARLLDAPNVTVRGLVHDGHVVSVALLAREGGLPEGLRDEMYRGGRVRGNMIPDVLTTQLRDREAAVPVGQRVLRIATHPAVQSRGLGSHLLAAIREEVADDVDWLGVGYGATPELVRFWATNGYATVHLSTTRNDASGEYSAVMLDPCSADGEALAERHTEWFLSRVGPTLSDPLDDLDPDVARAVLGTVDAVPDLDLDEWESRLLAGVPTGAAIFDTDPDPFRRLAVRHLVEHENPAELTDREEQLLVRKVLQGHRWGRVAEELAYHSHAECMRAFGDVVERLIRRYADEETVRALEDGS